MTDLTRSTWIAHCAQQLEKLARFTVPTAHDLASTLADEQAKHNGASGLAWEAPEDVANQWAIDTVEDDGDLSPEEIK